MSTMLSVLFKQTKIKNIKIFFYCTLAVSLLHTLVEFPVILVLESYVLLEDVDVRVMNNSHL